VFYICFIFNLRTTALLCSYLLRIAFEESSLHLNAFSFIVFEDIEEKRNRVYVVYNIFIAKIEYPVPINLIILEQFSHYPNNRFNVKR
jgi:hypothetical protein